MHYIDQIFLVWNLGFKGHHVINGYRRDYKNVELIFAAVSFTRKTIPDLYFHFIDNFMR